jgi:hypothetical protein
MGLSRETLPSLFDFNENDEIDLFDLNESSSNLNLTKEKMDKLYAKLLENEDGRDGEYSDDDDDFDVFEENEEFDDWQKENVINRHIWNFDIDDEVHNCESEKKGETPNKKLKIA